VDYICGSGNVELVRNDSRLNEITIFDRSLSGWARLFKMAVRRRYDGFISTRADDYLFDDDGVFAVIWNPADQASPALARSARGRSLAAFCFDDHASSDRLPGCWGFS